MLEGTCHCGEVRWIFNHVPGYVKACNCTVCRRYGVLWAYGHEDEDVEVFGQTRAYMWGGQGLAFNFCTVCGCVAYWRACTVGEDGRRRIAVNVRLAEPARVAAIPVEQFDGLQTHRSLPRNGQCIADLWF